jgi:hypothetical protein
MLTRYRVTFDEALVYQLEFSRMSEADGLFSLLVYRVSKDRRESRPLQRNDGQPMRFEAATRRMAMALACDVLQSIHGKHLQSIVSCD